MRNFLLFIFLTNSLVGFSQPDKVVNPNEPPPPPPMEVTDDYPFIIAEEESAEEKEEGPDLLGVAETCAELFVTHGTGKSDFFPEGLLKKLKVTSCTAWMTPLITDKPSDDAFIYRVLRMKYTDGMQSELVTFEGLHTGLSVVGMPQEMMRYYRDKKRTRQIHLWATFNYESRYAFLITNEGIDEYLVEDVDMTVPTITDAYGDVENGKGKYITMMNDDIVQEPLYKVTPANVFDMKGDTVVVNTIDTNKKKGLITVETTYTDKYVKQGYPRYTRTITETKKDTAYTNKETDGKNTLATKKLIDKNKKPITVWVYNEKGEVSRTEQYTYDGDGRVETIVINHSKQWFVNQSQRNEVMRYEFHYAEDGLLHYVNCWLDNRGVSLLFKYTRG